MSRPTGWRLRTRDSSRPKPRKSSPAIWSKARPVGLNKVWLTCGGSESVEAALKLTRQYFVESGAGAEKIRDRAPQGYHGNTFGALSASGNIWRRRPFEPVLIDSIQHIRRATPIATRPRTKPRKRTACAWRTSSKRKSSSSAPTRSPPSSPRPSSVRRSAR